MLHLDPLLEDSMAVKKHELASDNLSQLDLTALAHFLQSMTEQSIYLPPDQELVRHCQEIVKCLARSSGSVEQLWQYLQPVEKFLIRVISTVHCDMRHEVFTAILAKFYSFISDPQSDACPATAAVLVVIDESDEEGALSAARWLVQQKENGPDGAGLRAALSCLYRWLPDWQGDSAFSNWMIAYIKALEENEQYDILIETSLDNVIKLFLCMEQPAKLHQKSADVIFHVLTSLRESTDAFDRISSHVGNVLVKLAADSGQWSRQLLQNLVDILTAMVDGITASLKNEAQDIFRAKYADVILCLEQHMASRACNYLQLVPWRTRVVCLSGVNANVPLRKVGLLNLGNTCYMNSVMQALLVTRQFSTHVMLRMTAVPYWAKMSVLFAQMMHSISTKLNPDELFKAVKPPFFTKDNQQDSSEFLSYLFELLQSYEHCSDRNFDYSRPPVLNLASRLRMIHPHSQQQPQLPSGDEHAESSQSRRSISPRPGSSSGSGSSGLKRNSSDQDTPPMLPRKRFRTSEATFLRRDSFIDNMFGGVLLTRVECTVCHASSLSHDVFRDLQLAFPEKTVGWQYSVQSLLEYYCSKESLSGDNQYECRDCGCLRDAERNVLIDTTPKYLVLVLKNFKFDAKLQVQAKLMQTMYYNHTVTLPTVRTQAVHASYNFFAAVIHAGTTLDSGHYYTLAKDNDQWHIYNDDVVSYTDESYLNKLNRSSTPYILFYRRTDIEESTAPSFQELPPKLQETVFSHNKHYVDTVRKIRLTRP